MKQIKTTDALGCVLCHDITQIIKGVTKDAVFRKGHIVQEADIPVLLSLGKDNLFVWEPQEGVMHENDAAQVLYELCAGENMHAGEVKEGKIDVIADSGGLLLVDIEKLRRVNSLGEMMIATRHSGTPVKKGDKLAGTRIIPLVIRDEKMEIAKEAGAGNPILTLKPFLPKKVGIITTGNEVFYGRIEDAFTPVVEDKVKELGGEVISRAVLPDSPEGITEHILSAIQSGAQLVLCTGGMSVDPDDRTPLAIKNTGAQVVGYGAPVLPGAMFMLAYFRGVPIMGLPGCVMYSKRTIFDLILPRIMANVRVTADDIAGMGHGGLCLSCDICTYPNCGFGKGY